MSAPLAVSADRSLADTATREVTSLRDVTPVQWRAFWAVFLGWIVDSFDFNIAAIIVLDIQKSFTVDSALAGALGTVTLLMRLIGGSLAGTAADKWGRKLPLTLAVLWLSLFAFLSGF
jgi:MFS family permease